MLNDQVSMNRAVRNTCRVSGCSRHSETVHGYCSLHQEALDSVPLADDVGEKRDGGKQKTYPEHSPVARSVYERPIDQHGGAKYLRVVHPADGKGEPINVDVYCVIEAFGITCPALAHALKKILACGQRGKGTKLDDIDGVFDAMWRARELQKQREAREESDSANERSAG